MQGSQGLWWCWLFHGEEGQGPNLPWWWWWGTLWYWWEKSNFPGSSGWNRSYLSTWDKQMPDSSPPPTPIPRTRDFLLFMVESSGPSTVPATEGALDQYLSREMWTVLLQVKAGNPTKQEVMKTKWLLEPTELVTANEMLTQRMNKPETTNDAMTVSTQTCFLFNNLLPACTGCLEPRSLGQSGGACGWWTWPNMACT